MIDPATVRSGRVRGRSQRSGSRFSNRPRTASNRRVGTWPRCWLESRRRLRRQRTQRGLLTELSADLAHLIPGVTGVAVDQDLANGRWELSISTRSQAPDSGRVADGRLRLLALLTALNDPLYGGLICLEEPENGLRLESRCHD